MKNQIFFILITIFVLLLSFILVSCRRTSVPYAKRAELRYQIGGETVSTEISDNDTQHIRSILSNRILYRDNPSCGFTQNVSISFDGKVYCFACDGCSIIQDFDAGRYFSLDDTLYKTVIEILSKYGLSLPCI